MRQTQAAVILGFFSWIAAFPIIFSDQALGQSRKSSSRVSEKKPKDASAFEASFSTGVGLWTAPALPRLVIEGSTEKLDIDNYSKEAQGLHFQMESNLYFPLFHLMTPMGIQIKVLNLSTESSSLSFTISGDKAKIRPRHLVAIEAGLKSLFDIGEMKAAAGLNLAFSRTIYLNANLTSVAPSLLFQLDSHEMFGSWLESR